MAYERGLETFLRGASTPITVALQGEWGSGKTSLMNVLRDDLCGTNKDEGEYFYVWINTWEYSLMRDSNNSEIHRYTNLKIHSTPLPTNSRGRGNFAFILRECAKLLQHALT